MRQPESGNAPGKNTLAGLVNPSSGQFLFKLPGIYFFPVQHEDFFVVVCLLVLFLFPLCHAAGIPVCMAACLADNLFRG